MHLSRSKQFFKFNFDDAYLHWHTYTYIYIPICAYLHLHTYMFLPTSAYLYVPTYICIPICAYLHRIPICSYLHLHTFMCLPTSAYLYVPTYMCIPIRAYLHVHRFVVLSFCSYLLLNLYILISMSLPNMLWSIDVPTRWMYLSWCIRLFGQRQINSLTEYFYEKLEATNIFHH